MISDHDVLFANAELWIAFPDLVDYFSIRPKTAKPPSFAFSYAESPDPSSPDSFWSYF